MELRTPLPEALDRLSILTLKLEHTPENDPRRTSVKKEYDFYRAVVESYRTDGTPVQNAWLDELVAVNRTCWDMEDAIREGKEGGLTLEEVGRRALELRDLNKQRISVKNRIAKECGLDFFEVKIRHASE